MNSHCNFNTAKNKGNHSAGHTSARVPPGESKTKSGLSFEEHRELGATLQAMLITLHRLHTKYNKSSKVMRLARRTAKAIDDFRCEMDNRACAESPRSIYPDREPHRLYYGKGILWLY